MLVRIFNGIIGKSTNHALPMFACLKRTSGSSLSADSGRKRHRQRTGGPRHSLSFRPRRAARHYCGALPDSIIESELFGYEKGAYPRWGVATKSPTRAPSSLQITETSLNTQGKPLKSCASSTGLAAQNRSPLDLIIAATNRDTEMVKGGSFRHDLYYRINEMTISLPPCAQTTLPVDHSSFCRPAAPTRPRPQILKDYNWLATSGEPRKCPSNGLLFSQTVIMPEHFPAAIEKHETAGRQPVPKPNSKKCWQTPNAIFSTDRAGTGHNVSKTADALQVSRRTLQRKIKQLGLEKKTLCLEVTCFDESCDLVLAIAFMLLLVD